MKLTKLCFIFENCDSATIDAKYVDRISIANLRNNIYVQQTDVFENTFSDYTKITLTNYLDIEYESMYDDKKCKLFDRLKSKDVTGITLYYDNNTEATFHTPWGDKDWVSEYQNVQEKECRTGESYLEITFDKEHKV